MKMNIKSIKKFILENDGKSNKKNTFFELPLYASLYQIKKQ